MTYRIVDLIDSLWSAARYRYVTKAGGVSIRRWDKSPLAPLLETEPSTFTFDKSEEKLLYYAAEPSDQ